MKFYATSKVDNLRIHIPEVTQSKRPQKLCCSPARDGAKVISRHCVLGYWAATGKLRSRLEQASAAESAPLELAS